MNGKSTKRNILFLILILTVVVVVIDLSLAGFLIKNKNRTFRTAHYYYHHGLLPNQKALSGWYNIPYTMFTNSLGFRDSEIRSVPLESNKKRILFMGDSHAEGVGVNFDQTFTGQLISALDTSQTEILNSAVVSYSPRIYYLKTKYLIEEVGLKFDQLFVFIDMSDLQNEIVYQNFQPEVQNRFKEFFFDLKNRTLNKSFILHTITTLMQNRQTAGFLKQAAVFDEYRQDKDHVDALKLYASFFSGFNDKTLLSNPQFHGVSGWMYDDDFRVLAQKGLDLGKENMLKLYDLCKKHGISMAISVHPWKEQIELRQPEDMVVNFWKNFAKETGVGFINLYPVFINPPVSAAMGMEFFIPGDNHWNKNGHWLVANVLNEYINKNF